MSTLRNDLKELAEAFGPVLLVRVSNKSGWESDWAAVPCTPPADLPAELLDREYDDGYGLPGIPCSYAWTATHVCFVAQYDGATWWNGVPRNPTNEGHVEMPGSS